MKIPPARQDAFLRAPDPAIVAILFYGPDGGTIRERADQVMRAVVGAPPDPFRSAELTGAEIGRDPALLADEAAAQSLIGGRRALRIREAGNEIVPALRHVLEMPGLDTLIVIEAGDLPARAALRQLCETSDRAAALACYEIGPDGLAQLAAAMIEEAGRAVDREALELLAGRLAGDRQLARREIEKLLAYVGEAPRITAEDVRLCVGDSLEQSMDDVALAAADGDPQAVERALGRLLAEGASEIAILRAVQRHFTRLHAAVARLEAGETPDGAVAAANVFFKTRPRFRSQVMRWRRPRIEQALERLVEAEAQCKQTGAPTALICGRVLLQVALLGRNRPTRAA